MEPAGPVEPGTELEAWARPVSAADVLVVEAGVVTRASESLASSQGLAVGSALLTSLVEAGTGTMTSLALAWECPRLMWDS